MLHSNDIEYTSMTKVVQEITNSFKKNNDHWELDVVRDDTSDVLVLRHIPSDIDYRVSNSYRHFHVEVDNFFDVVEYDGVELTYIGVFSNTQKKSLFRVFTQEFTPFSFIQEYADNNGITLNPFKSDTQSKVYHTFINTSTNRKYGAFD